VGLLPSPRLSGKLALAHPSLWRRSKVPSGPASHVPDRVAATERLCLGVSLGFVACLGERRRLIGPVPASSRALPSEG